MREYPSRAPPLYRISPNLKRTVTYRNIKNVGFTNTHATHVNYHMSGRLAVASKKRLKEHRRYIKKTLNQYTLYVS
jgi:hypothetical protein